MSCAELAMRRELVLLTPILASPSPTPTPVLPVPVPLPYPYPYLNPTQTTPTLPKPYTYSRALSVAPARPFRMARDITAQLAGASRVKAAWCLP